MPGGYILGLRKQGKGMLELLLNGIGIVLVLALWWVINALSTGSGPIVVTPLMGNSSANYWIVDAPAWTSIIIAL